MKRRQKGKIGHFAAKIDMAKAHDRVEWSFLEGAMRKMGFAEAWVQKIMVCVRSVTYSILVNGNQSAAISPGRGIRQGDPLSPYLFLLCAEGLSAYTEKAVQEKRLHGLQPAAGAPVISHLFFADDSIFFARATQQECIILKEILSDYERESGQLVSFQKSEVSFSKNVSPHNKLIIGGTLGMSIVEKHEKYLGLATTAGRSKKELFSGLVDRVRKKLKGWKERVMSVAAREVLIKSVVQAQLSYAMSVFKIPEGILEQVHSLMTTFWWGQKGSERRVHWIRREELVCPKMEGGMGFRDMKGFNLALLAKQLWNLYQRPESLIARILRAKYHKRSSILEANVGHNPSFVWRSLFTAQEFLHRGLRWRIGNGDSVRIWGDKWIPHKEIQYVTSSPRGLPVDARVSDLIDPITEVWDLPTLEKCFPAEMIQTVLQIPLRGFHERDKLIWSSSKDGNYTVKDGYHVWLQQFKVEEGVEPAGDEGVWKKLWAAKVAPKVKIFLWKFARNVLPTGDHISGKSQRWGDQCPFCNLKETQLHFFGDCSWTSRIWRASDLADCFEYQPALNCFQWLQQVMDRVDDEKLGRWSVLLWFLWKERNAQMFNGVKVPEEEITTRAWSFFDDYQRHQQLHPIQQEEKEMSEGWKKPGLGSHKINTDVGVDEADGIRLGVVIRDSGGKFLLSATKRVHGSFEVEMGEALAAEYGMQLALQFAITHPILESDCLPLIQKIDAAASIHTEIGVICRNIRHIFNEIGQGSWNHVRRMANEAAHIMAHSRDLSSNAIVWLDNPPPCLVHQLQLDNAMADSD
ncbi:unnamed protein product [Linum trigynum]|uniref:Reverse transcriptase domain-containing protein n=1 Tax=Linum trigynum TaxID=586398 RepID=A0AAV2DK10_9ROSI